MCKVPKENEDIGKLRASMEQISAVADNAQQATGQQEDGCEKAKNPQVRLQVCNCSKTNVLGFMTCNQKLNVNSQETAQAA